MECIFIFDTFTEIHPRSSPQKGRQGGRVKWVRHAGEKNWNYPEARIISSARMGKLHLFSFPVSQVVRADEHGAGLGFQNSVAKSTLPMIARNQLPLIKPRT